MKYGRYLMGFIQKSSFQQSTNRYANLGDYVQVLAMDEIYQQLGIQEEDLVRIPRDETASYCGKAVMLPFFSEFARENIRQRIRFSEQIHVPALISAVMYEDFDVLEPLAPGCEAFFHAHQPIGCRDEKSRNLLRAHGMEAYLMGCFTICFPKRKVTPKSSKVFFIDISEACKAHIPAELLACGEFLTHAEKIQAYPMTQVEDARLEAKARTLLERYRQEATLIVTGRLHAALPCMAMGIPVVLACDNLDFRFSWVEKYIHPYQLDEYGQIDWNPKPVDMENVKKIMLLYFQHLLHNDSTREELQWLDTFYSNREKVETYLTFRNLLRKEMRHPQDDFRYAIWGAGYHAGYAYELMREMFPNAKLAAVVDKYKTGTFHGIPIQRGEALQPENVDHLIITTIPGSKEAMAWRNHLAPRMPCTVICSQQKS